MRIAVIGSGISGLGAAYLLAPNASVTLYERDTRLGGHANTVSFLHDGHALDVDTGFIVCNPIRYPYFMKLLEELEVETTATNMSFSVSIPGKLEYSSDLSGIFCDARQLGRTAYWRLLADILRFNRVAKRFMEDSTSDKSITLRQFLQQQKFSHELIHEYLFPMLGCIWSASSQAMYDYPAYESFIFLDNHLLLNVFNKPVWHTVTGGSHKYVQALHTILQSEGVQIRTGQEVVSIARSNTQALVSTNEHTDTFDAVVVTTHADVALQMLADPSEDERRVLGAFSYSANTAVLHGDSSFMPVRRGAWAAWNYHAPLSQTSAGISLTYDMNTLQHIPAKHPTYVTLNPQRSIATGKEYGRFPYTHPVLNAKARDAQKCLSHIQGKRNTYFAGAHWKFGFHEDGLESAVRVAEALGIQPRLKP